MMNERIKQLARRVVGKRKDDVATISLFDEQIEQFAELIVRECVSIVAKRKDQAIDDGWKVDEAMSMAEMDLEEHFGVDTQKI